MCSRREEANDTLLIALFNSTPTRLVTMAVEQIVTEPSLAAVLQISDQARDQADSLVQLINQASGGRVSAEVQAEIAKQQKQLFTSISHLRGLFRAACFSARETRAATAESRQAVDRLHLQMQNLYYEQRHLQGEILACESYERVTTTSSKEIKQPC